MRGLKLHTVCEEARCPNIGECWGNRTATFMILGDVCTRACRYCAVTSGKPHELDLTEPLHVAEAVRQMGLKHAVVTSVDRDDLADFGATHFAETIRQIQELNPDCAVEVLTPDFQAKRQCFEAVLEADRTSSTTTSKPSSASSGGSVPGDPTIESRLRVLKRAKELDGGVLTKSGLMVGLGETLDEVKTTLDDLRENDVDILTIGQYLRPTAKHVAIDRYVHPDEFADLKSYGPEYRLLARRVRAARPQLVSRS